MGLLVYMICISFLNAQPAKPKTDTIDMLRATPWVEFYNNKTLEYYRKYEHENIIYTSKDCYGRLKTGSSQYYLSNTVEKTFDSTKIGKIRNGEYIITHGREFVYKSIEIFNAQMKEVKYEILERVKLREAGKVCDTLIPKKTQELNDSIGEWIPVVRVIKIIKISKEELVLQHIFEEIRIGNRPAKYVPYEGDIKNLFLNK